MIVFSIMPLRELKNASPVTSLQGVENTLPSMPPRGLTERAINS